MGTPCNGEIKERPMFDNQMMVPTCDFHYEEHINVMTLHQNGYDIEEILQQTNEWRKAEVEKLVASGVNISKIQL